LVLKNKGRELLQSVIFLICKRMAVYCGSIVAGGLLETA
jgi:hypothetical protein